MAAADLHELLAGYEAELAATDACRDGVGACARQLGTVIRKASALVQAVHHAANPAEIAAICAQVRASMTDLGAIWHEMYAQLNGRPAESYVFRRSWSLLILADSDLFGGRR